MRKQSLLSWSLGQVAGAMGKEAIFYTVLPVFKRPIASLQIKAIPASGHRDFRDQRLGLIMRLIQKHSGRNTPNKKKEREGKEGF